MSAWRETQELVEAIKFGKHGKIKLLHQKDKALLHSKVKINLLDALGRRLPKDEGYQTVLNVAIASGSQATVIFLMDEFKLDILETDFYGRNCVFMAVWFGKIETAKYLHSLDETLVRARDDDDDTVLCWASKVSSKKIVQWMIEKTNVAGA